MINFYLCRIQRTEIIAIFIKERKMVNNSKLQLMYFRIFFGLSIAQLNFFVTLLLLNQKYLLMQRTRLAIIMKKREIRKKLLLEKTRTARRSSCVKKGRTNACCENFIINKVVESNGRIIFKCHENVFTSYVMC